MARFINKKTGVIANVPDGFAMGADWVTPEEVAEESTATAEEAPKETPKKPAAKKAAKK